MKLFKLEVKDHCERESGNPWNPWFDKTFAVVIRAESKEAALAIANEKCNPTYHGFGRPCGMAEPWSNPEWVVCEELTIEGEPGVIVVDCHEA